MTPDATPQPPKVPLSMAARTFTERLKLAKHLGRARKRGLKLFVVGVWSGNVIEVVPDKAAQPEPSPAAARPVLTEKTVFVTRFCNPEDKIQDN